MGNWISQKEKEGHLKTKTEFKKKQGQLGGPSETAAVYDVEKTKGNSYNAVNRHLIKKLRG